MPPPCSDAENQTPPLTFQGLERLRLFSSQILQDQVASLEYFAYRSGYKHLKSNNKVSVSSTGTCVLSLVATGLWTASREHTKPKTKALLKSLIRRSTSAGLPNNNPFTIAWILETVDALEKDYSDSLDGGDKALIAKMERTLQDAIKNGHGGVKIDQYPSSAYLTQLLVRVLRRRSKLTPTLEKIVNTWAWAELTRQLTLIQAKSKTADAFAVAYLLMLVTAVTPSSRTNPEQTSTQRAALKTFFECQENDGTWPLSRPLFHYKKLGNAYCYEYEMLAQLLQQNELQNLLLDYLPQLSLSAASVSNSVYRVEDGVQSWTSGHHPQQGDPESWATASVYHFVHELDRLVAEGVRRELFRYLELPLPRSSARRSKKSDFAEGFLDSKVQVKTQRRSLKAFLWENFVKPLADEAGRIVEGRTFGKRTPRSAIFFGPPGTSKTELSQKIADFLGWPLLAIDPSHLLRNGMDGIQAEANAIFRILEQTERVVVLFDEFDELVLERGSPKAEAFSRFLTTAMLPKLASIHKRATLVFLIATNNIGDFDLAIRRQGRFDHVVQIMPPTYESKIEKKDWGSQKIDLVAKLQTLRVAASRDINKKIGDLTYSECDDFATELANATTAKMARSILLDHWDRCTLNASVSKTVANKEGETTTWAKRCAEEAVHNR
jgi:hypothetical protein